MEGKEKEDKKKQKGLKKLKMRIDSHSITDTKHKFLQKGILINSLLLKGYFRVIVIVIL